MGNEGKVIEGSVASDTLPSPASVLAVETDLKNALWPVVRIPKAGYAEKGMSRHREGCDDGGMAVMADEG